MGGPDGDEMFACDLTSIPVYSIAVIPKLLQAIQTDGLVGLIGTNKVLLTLSFGLSSFRKSAIITHNGKSSILGTLFKNPD